MKKLIALLFLTVFLVMPKAWSHALWIETNPIGEIGKEQSIKVFFGEYSYGVIEMTDSDAYKKVEQFSVWITTPSGKKVELKSSPKASYFLVKYTPTEKGAYSIELDNHEIDVIDYTKYDFGIFKTHYRSSAVFVVGDKTNEVILTDNQGLTIQNISNDNDSLRLKIYYKGELFRKSEVSIAIADNWNKTLYTDENGEIVFAFLPWKNKYFIEVSTKEEIPGVYNNVPYEFIWHCATYMSLPSS